MIEHLEPRRLMSANMQDNGVLVITGTDADDHVSLRLREGRLVLIENGVRTSYNAAPVTTVTINAANGNNRIVLGRNLNQQCNVSAGDGDDLIIGTDADDFLNAGNGKNRIMGRGGNDNLSSNGTGDTLNGGRGNDTLSSFAQGSSQLVGGPGVDLAQFKDPAAVRIAVENHVSTATATEEGTRFDYGGISVAVDPSGEVKVSLSFSLGVRYDVSHDAPHVDADGRIVSALQTALDPNYDTSLPQPAVSDMGTVYEINLGVLKPGRHVFVLEHEGQMVAEAYFSVGR